MRRRLLIAILPFFLAATVHAAGVELTATAGGLAPERVFCRNLSTGQEVVSATSQAVWDCATLGLVIESGDRIETGVLGRLPDESRSRALESPLPEDFLFQAVGEPALTDLFPRLRLADLDGDGDDDLVVADRLLWLENLEADPQEFRPHLLGDGVTTESLINMETLDINGDGRADIFGGVASTPHTYKLIWLENLGGPPVEFDTHPLFEREGFTLWAHGGGDIDGDGDMDVLTGLDPESGCAPCRNEFLWLEQRSGSWFPHTIFSLLTDGPFGFAYSTFDMDGDHDLDVLIDHGENDTLVWLENVAGVFEEQRPLLADFNVDMIEQADLDGDGDLDLLISGQTSEDDTVSEVRWLENRGTEPYESHTLFELPPVFFTLHIGEISGDGRPDFVATHKASVDDPGFLHWFENRAGEPLEFLPHLDAAPLGMGFPEATDLNSDGRLDLVDALRHELRWYLGNVGLRLNLAGATARLFTCRNLTSGERLLVHASDNAIDCQHEGMAVEPGDRVLVQGQGSVD